MFALPMDVNADGRVDLVVGSKNENAIVGWLENPANPRDTANWKLHELSPASWIMSLRASDLDGDGDEEFALTAPGANDGDGVVYIIPGFYEVNAAYHLGETFSPAVTPNATAPVLLVGDDADALEHLSLGSHPQPANSNLFAAISVVNGARGVLKS